VSTDLYTPFASEFVGNWWYLKGDGTVPTGSLAITAVNSPTANTLAMSGHSSGVSTQYTDGVNQYFYTPPTPYTGSISVGAWVTFDGLAAGSMQVVSCWNTGLYFMSYISSTGVYTVNYSGQGIVTGPTLTPRVPYFMVWTYEPVGAGTSRLVVYQNGVQVAQTATIGLYVNAAQRWTIGAKENTAPNEFLKGNIAHAFLTEKALDPYTVLRMYETLAPVLKTSNGERLSYARSNPASFIDSAGRVGWVPPNQPRLVDGAFLHEPAHTSGTYTEGPVLAGTASGTTVLTGWSRTVGGGGEVYTDGTFPAVFAPDGSKTMVAGVYIGNTTTTKYSYLGYTVSGLTIGSTYTASVWAQRYPAGGSGGLDWFIASGANHGFTTDTIQGGPSYPFTRLTKTFVATATSVVVAIGNRYSITGVDATTAKQFFLWGMQVNAGSTASSYVRADASAVTRNVDNLLVPMGRSNHALYSSDASFAPWSGGSGATIGANTLDTTAPDGTYTAAKVTASGAGNIPHQAGTNANASMTSGRRYVWSLYMKRGNARYATFDKSGNWSGLTLDFDTGTIVQTVPPRPASNKAYVGTLDPKMEAVGGGWWRVSFVSGCELTGDFITAGPSPTAAARTPGSAVTFVQAGETVYVCGASISGWEGVDTDRLDGSLIATTTAKATAYRWNEGRWPTLRGSITLDYLHNYDGNPPGDSFLFDAGGVASSGGVTLRITSSGVLRADTYNTVGGSTGTLSAAQTWTRGQTYRLKVSWANGVVNLYRDGALLLSEGSKQMPDAWATNFDVGTQANGTNAIYGTVKNIRIRKG